MTGEDQYIALSDQWILYPNKDSNILYKLSLIDSRYFILNGVVGVIFSLLDGKNTFAGYVKIVHELFSFPSLEATARFLENVFVNFNKEEEVILISDRKISKKKKYNPSVFVVKQEHFKIPKRLLSPIRLLIYPTGRCTTDCVYCYADIANLRKCREMTIAEWSKIFGEARDLGLKIIDITGGDLFARKDAADFVCELIKYDFLFFISTKSFITAEDALKMRKAGFKRKVLGEARGIQLSIDTSDNEEAKQLVNVDGYVQRIEQTTVNLIKAGIVPKIKSVITGMHVNKIEDLILRFKKLGVTEFHLVKYEDSLYRHEDYLSLTEEQLEEIRTRLNSLAQSNRDIFISGNLTENVDYRKGKDGETIQIGTSELMDVRRTGKVELSDLTGCSGGRTTLGVLPDGRGCLCEQMLVVEPFIFGNFKEQSISEIWNSDELENICFPEKSKFEGTVCYQCSDFEECVILKGQCFRDNYFGRNPSSEKGNIYVQPANCYKLKQYLAIDSLHFK